MDFVSSAGKYHHKIGINNILKENPTSDQVKEPVSYTHLTLPTTPYV